MTNMIMSAKSFPSCPHIITHIENTCQLYASTTSTQDSLLIIKHYTPQVTKGGKIIDEKTYRLNMAKKEHQKHVRDLLATAIVHKTLDLEVRICI